MPWYGNASNSIEGSNQDNWGGCQIEDKTSASASSFRIGNFSDRKTFFDALLKEDMVE